MIKIIYIFSHVIYILIINYYVFIMILSDIKILAIVLKHIYCDLIFKSDE